MNPLAGGMKSEVLAAGLEAVEVPLATSENVDEADEAKTLLLSAAGAPRTAPAKAKADSKEETLNILGGKTWKRREDVLLDYRERKTPYIFLGLPGCSHVMSSIDNNRFRVFRRTVEGSLLSPRPH